MTAPSSRFIAMDVLRGWAVLGILWMNVSSFALPQNAYFNPRLAGPLSMEDTLFWLVSFLFFDGKMRALFSMLFGASMLLLIDREEMAGRHGQRAQIVRAAWLFVIGLAHYMLLWSGDILMIYAIVGLAALLFAGKEPLSLIKWAFLFFLLHFFLCAAFMGSLHAWSHAASASDATLAARQSFADFASSYTDPRHAGAAAEIATYRGGLSTIVGYHAALFATNWPWGFLFSALDTLGFMLLGMAMLKSGFLTGRWDVAQYMRTARHCFLVGLPPMILLATWLILAGFPVLGTMGTALAWSFPFRIPLAVGWTALVLGLFLRHRDQPVVGWLRNVGRMALSNYVGASVLMCAIFYGWGLGLFATIRPAELPLFILGGWIAMMVGSAAWQSRFVLGPLEWLWRSLARGRPQKIRKSG